MDSRAASGCVARRTFLTASLAGLAALAPASRTSPQPNPTPKPSPTTSPTPTPTPPANGVPLPAAMQRSRWGTDPFARGAFCFDSVGDTDRLRGALSTPVADRLFFA